MGLVWCGAVIFLLQCGDDLTVNPVPGGRPDAMAVDAARDTGPVLDAHDARDAPTDTTDAADAACAPIDAALLDAAQVSLGRDIVKYWSCEGCHSQGMSGNDIGVSWQGSGRAYPPNLTPDPETGLGCWSPLQIENAILHGIDDQGRRLCPPMPIFAEAGVDTAGAAAVVAFLRSLPPVSHRVPDTSCTGASDAGDAETTDAPSDAPDGPTDARDADAD